MSSTTVDRELRIQPPPFPIYRFAVAEYEALGRAGILTEDDNVELLNGWIVPKMTKHPPHDGAIAVIQYLLLQLIPSGWHLRNQSAIKTADSMPEPDFAVVRGKPGDYRRRHPSGREVGIVIEVADATVARDRSKAEIYARAGVPVYWLVNLDDAQIEVFSQPAGTGRKRTYRECAVLRGKTNLSVMLAGKEIGKISVREILG